MIEDLVLTIGAGLMTGFRAPLFTGLIAVVITYLLTPYVRNMAIQKGAVDDPNLDDRRVHTKPIPRWGGLAIYAGIVIAVAIVMPFAFPTTKAFPPYLIGMLVIAGFLVVVGALDDLYQYKAKIQALVLILSGVAVQFFYEPAGRVQINTVGFPIHGPASYIVLGALAVPLTALYIFVVTKTMDTIDGVDGLSAGIATISAGTLVVIAVQGAQPRVAIVAAAIAGSALGFLRHNYNPAKIFMGTGGAYVLGFLMACLSIVGALKTAAAVSLIIPVLVFGVPMVDAFVVILRRLLSGQPITQGISGIFIIRYWAEDFPSDKPFLCFMLRPLPCVRSQCLSFVEIMSKPVIFCVIGTRPEAIKLAPVMLEFLKYSNVCQPMLISTGQHKEILYRSLETFGLKPDEDLEIMQHGSTLAQVTSRALEGLDNLVAQHKPSYVLGQGDTTTAMVSAMDAFYRDVPFGHVEAGLRTDTVRNPFPEEYNRRICAVSANLHFPPTEWSRDNLLRENRDPKTIFVTGNTGIDAVLLAAEQKDQPWYPEHQGRVVILTTHRRENWGEPQRQIATAARRLVERFPDILLVAALHPNPLVRDVLIPILGGHDRINLIEPPDYSLFVKLMHRSHLILSDSGGVQEEAPAFGIPVLVLRDTTERPEGVTAGTAKLVGTNEERIFQEGSVLLGDNSAYRAMANAVSPYGDGKASARIRYLVLKELGINSPEVPMWE